ncbi:hypothetical protein TNCV_1843621 [Trichonephila clavipes]|nr:hypothetical protein TNCV_1843621 [Trichonephila clavipes]
MVCESRVPFLVSAYFEESKHLSGSPSLWFGDQGPVPFNILLHPAGGGKKIPRDGKGRWVIQDGTTRQFKVAHVSLRVW